MGLTNAIDFYRQSDTVGLARKLIGKRLCTEIHGVKCAGIINETEAYCGVTDRASHAYGGRKTDRTKTMYAAGGISYIYLCYGIHEMFNVVTGEKDDPQAILIRSIIPTEGTEEMMKRCNKDQLQGLADGPGKLCKALAIDRSYNGLALDRNPIWIEQAERPIDASEIVAGPRIGIDYAGADAALPYRFLWQGLIP